MEKPDKREKEQPFRTTPLHRNVHLRYEYSNWVYATKKIPVCQSKKENFGFRIKLLSFLHYAFFKSFILDVSFFGAQFRSLFSFFAADCDHSNILVTALQGHFV